MVAVLFLVYTGIAFLVGTTLCFFVLGAFKEGREGEVTQLMSTVVGLFVGGGVVIWRLSWAVDLPDFPVALVWGTGAAPLGARVAYSFLSLSKRLQALRILDVERFFEERDIAKAAVLLIPLALLLHALYEIVLGGIASRNEHLQSGAPLGNVAVTLFLYYLVVVLPWLWGIQKVTTAIRSAMRKAKEEDTIQRNRSSS